MVSFQCEGCTDVIKKPKLDSHHQRCGAPVSCVDCSVTFSGPKEWKSHTSCISEAQKYQKSLYKGPKNQKDGKSGPRGDKQPKEAQKPSEKVELQEKLPAVNDASETTSQNHPTEAPISNNIIGRDEVDVDEVPLGTETDGKSLKKEKKDKKKKRKAEDGEVAAPVPDDDAPARRADEGEAEDESGKKDKKRKRGADGEEKKDKTDKKKKKLSKETVDDSSEKDELDGAQTSNGCPSASTGTIEKEGQLLSTKKKYKKEKKDVPQVEPTVAVVPEEEKKDGKDGVDETVHGIEETTKADKKKKRRQRKKDQTDKNEVQADAELVQGVELDGKAVEMETEQTLGDKPKHSDVAQNGSSDPSSELIKDSTGDKKKKNKKKKKADADSS